MKKLMLAIAFFLVPLGGFADPGDTSVVEFFQCKLKEGQKMEDVKANNVKWLANARKATGNEEVNSYLLETTVGDMTSFVFADVYPDMATWAAAKDAGDTETSEAIEATFNELMDCEKNRLYKSTET